MNLTQALVIFLFGGLGSLGRYLVGSWGLVALSQATGISFPWGTFLVNLLGCLFIGVFAAILKRLELAEWLRFACVVGFLGGFTTFSSYILDGAQLLDTDSTLKSLLYLAGSIIAGLLAFWLGQRITQQLLPLLPLT